MVLAATAAAMLIGPAASAEPSDNRDWGQVASNVAQLDTSESDGTGGAMGQHSRSTEAADNNGGFASSDNDFGLTNNVRDEDETNNGRDGVGNVSRDVHGTDPGDGGNGQHAVNNASLSGTLNPIDGQLTENAGGTSADVSDELLEGTTTEPAV
jgi:hypothetical protein